MGEVRILKQTVKRILALSLLLFLCVLSVLPVFAEDAEATEIHDPRLVDMAGLLDADDAANLTALLDSLSEKLQFEVVVVTTNDLDGKTPRDYADDYYDYHQYGYGKKHDGVLFLRYINGDSREVWISTTGEGIRAISEDDIQDIFDRMSDDFYAGRYYGAFLTYAEEVERLVEYHRSYKIIWVFVGLGCGLLVGLLVTGTMKASLKSVRTAHYAGNYVKDGSLKIDVARDIFLYRTITRVPRQTAERSGGSSHSGSSGTSHGGGGRSM